MSTAIASSPRPALDLRRQRHPYSPPAAPPPSDGACTAKAPVPLLSVHVPSLSDIPEEHLPWAPGSLHLNTFDGNNSTTSSDPEAQLKPPSRHSALIPGFRNQPPFMVWLRHSWLDILTQLLCLLVAQMIYLFATPLMPRYFPLYPGVLTSAWGLKHGKPYLAEYVTTLVSAIVSFAGPFLVMGAVGIWWTRDYWDSNAAIMGLGYALATATLFQSFIKWFVGGLRPHFLAYTAVVCTGDPKHIKEAQMSFPSGHASAAFAGFGFLALYLNAKFKILPRTSSTEDAGEKTGNGSEARRTPHWRLILWVLPWLIALLIAASKVRDGWHHPLDVLFGAVVGTLFAHMAFRCVFRGVYDGRVNHLPRD